MYNSKELIFDRELTFLSYGQPINAEFTVEEILTGDLWKVYQVNNNIYKAIPLFNADVITSSNPKDIVLEGNKCLILHVDDDTLITAKSDDTGDIHFYSLQLYAFAPYTKLDYLDSLSVYVIVYDEFLNTLNNVFVDVYVDNELIATVETDNQGIARYEVSEACEISFKYNDNVSNSVIISVGE